MKSASLNFENTRFLCIGEVMLDHFVYGSVGRISPEAPVPVVHAKQDIHMLGGAGNVIRNLVTLGTSGELIAVLGDDGNSSHIEELMHNEANVTLDPVYERARKVPKKSRFIAQGQQILRIDYEDLHPIDKQTETNFKNTIEKHLQSNTYDVMIISDYNKGSLPAGVCQTMIKKSTVPVVVDPKGKDFKKYSGATVLTPNLNELKEAVNFELKSQEDIDRAAYHIIEKLSLQALLLTRGSEGMSVYTQDNCITIDAKAKEVYDVSGAGDTVVATLAACIATGMDVFEAAQIANLAGSIVVGKVGTATVSADELNQALSTGTISNDEKIVTLSKAQDYAQFWQSRGLKVGFTNGCFDLLHRGHLHSLRSAAKKCDKLIVGLNSDESVSKLKGPTRPIQDELTRAELLASLEIIDLVVIFSDDTPLRLIEQIVPDRLFKGSDYTVSEVVGADVVIAHGGSVELIDLLPGHSTTNTTTRMRQV